MDSKKETLEKNSQAESSKAVLSIFSFFFPSLKAAHFSNRNFYPSKVGVPIFRPSLPLIIRE